MVETFPLEPGEAERAEQLTAGDDARRRPYGIWYSGELTAAAAVEYGRQVASGRSAQEADYGIWLDRGAARLAAGAGGKGSGMSKGTFKAGDRITWRQFNTPGEGWTPAAERSGTVWSQTTGDYRVSSAWWVHPDEQLPGDAYSVVYVARAKGTGARIYAEDPAPGELWSGNRPMDVPAARMAAAARVAAETKRANAERREVALAA